MPLPFLIALGLKVLIGVVIGAAAGALLTVIVVSLLDLDKIEEWFNLDKNKKLTQEDKRNIPLLIKEGMKEGKIHVVQGIFDEKKEEFVDGVRYKAKELDPELEREFRRNKDVITYQYS
jgi:hypothetical protein